MTRPTASCTWWREEGSAQGFNNRFVPVKALYARRLIPPQQQSGSFRCSLLIFTLAFNEILGAHALVHGQRVAASMMLVRCNFDVPIFQACLTEASDGPEHAIIGTTFLRNLDGLRSGRQR